MSVSTAMIPTTRDRLSWLWLVIGGALIPFAHVHWVIPVAAWLMPICLLRFTRTQRARVGVPALIIVYGLGVALAMSNGYLDPPPSIEFALLFYSGYGLVLALPYVADRLIASRLTGWLRTLVFPLAVTTLDWLMSFSPFPTFGSLAYSQYGLLPLVQVVSLTGIWGLTFLIAWGASAINVAWTGDFQRRVVRSQLVPFLAVFVAVMLFGSLRLVLAETPADTLRVAGLVPARSLWRYLPVADIARAGEADRAALQGELTRNLDDLFARTAQEARAGAQIVVWAETAAFILKENEAAVIDRARASAREAHIYLQLGLMTIDRTQHHPFSENRLVMIDPAGDVQWDYHKAFPVPIGDAAEISPGPKVVPTVETPLGRLAAVICFDADTPSYIRQAGLAQADVLLVPADDWFANRFDHAQMATFRAVENGVSLVRPTGKGISIAVDQFGRVLAFADFFASASTTLIASVPAQGQPTLYVRIGDSFAYLCAAGLFASVVMVWLRRSATQSVSTGKRQLSTTP